MLPIAFLTYCPWPFEHTAHDLRIRQQKTFVVDQSFGVGGTGARCGGAPQVPFTQVFSSVRRLERPTNDQRQQILQLFGRCAKPQKKAIEAEGREHRSQILYTP